jgi:hypothetical protein
LTLPVVRLPYPCRLGSARHLDRTLLTQQFLRNHVSGSFRIFSHHTQLGLHTRSRTSRTSHTADFGLSTPSRHVNGRSDKEMPTLPKREVARRDRVQAYTRRVFNCLSEMFGSNCTNSRSNEKGEGKQTAGSTDDEEDDEFTHSRVDYGHLDASNHHRNGGSCSCCS